MQFDSAFCIVCKRQFILICKRSCMKNPIYIEYRRSTLLGIILVLLLSALGAVVHYIRSLDDNVLQTKFRLSAVGNQLDSEFTPVLAFMEAVRRASLL